METKKTTLVAIFPSCLLVTNSQLFIKSSLGSLKMKLRLLNSSMAIIPNPVTAQTVRNALKESGFYSATKKKTPLLKRAHRIRRLQFAKYHENWTVEDWKRVPWTDETKIN